MANTSLSNKFNSIRDRQQVPLDLEKGLPQTTISPRWMESVKPIQDAIIRLEFMLNDVYKLQQRSLHSGGDTTLSNKVITEHRNIIKIIKTISQNIKSIEKPSTPQQDRTRTNIQSSLTAQLADISAKFQRQHTSYMFELERNTHTQPSHSLDDEDDNDGLVDYDSQLKLVTKDQQGAQSIAIAQRAQAIHDLRDEIQEVHEMFTQVNHLVTTQGVMSITF